jgi:hypothetical protein
MQFGCPVLKKVAPQSVVAKPRVSQTDLLITTLANPTRKRRDRPRMHFSKPVLLDAVQISANVSMRPWVGRRVNPPELCVDQFVDQSS